MKKEGKLSKPLARQADMRGFRSIFLLFPFFALMPLLFLNTCVGIIVHPDPEFADRSLRMYFEENGIYKDECNISLNREGIKLTLIGASYIYQNSIGSSSWILIRINCDLAKAYEDLKIRPDSIRITLSDNTMKIVKAVVLKDGKRKYTIDIKAICSENIDCTSAGLSELNIVPKAVIDLSKFLEIESRKIEIGRINAFLRKPQ